MNCRLKAKARYTLSFRKVQPPSKEQMHGVRVKTRGKNGE